MTSSRRRWVLAAISVPLLGIAFVLGGWWWYIDSVRSAQEAHARAVFQPARDAMQAAREEPVVDLDKTVRVIHAVDRAVTERDDLQEFLTALARADYRGVAPDVLAARDRLLDVLMRLYAQQTRLENQEATFTVTRTVLSAMSLLNVDLSTAAGVPPGLDTAQAQTILGDLRKDQQARKELLDGLVELESELIGAMTEYSAVYYKWVGEWDRVVARRDRAYLAAAAGNWAAAESAAREAIELAPQETEAHLLLALSLIESSRQAPETDRLPEALEVLDRYLDGHPDRTAPALLLRGVAASLQGRTQEAALSFEQASAYYPRQAEILTDMLDPYQARAYLRRSREGQRIVDLYRATMLGAGAFSPDLQHARMLYAAGESDAARKKVLDHFSRRRNQARWDLILADVEFCANYFGAEFDAVFVEDSHLFLQVEPTLLGSKLDVRVQNGTQREVRNATLLLALRFTDMHREDFEVFKVGETVPVVAPRSATRFGELPVEYEFLGQKKGVDDIVLHRAILVADDAVMWVDTDEHRLALARTDAADEATRERWYAAMKTSPEELQRAVVSSAEVGLDLGLGDDDVLVQLPRELALLNPVFRLRRDGNESAPEANVLDRDKIDLRFADVANFDDATTGGAATLVVSSRWGSFEVDLDLARRAVRAVRFVR